MINSSLHSTYKFTARSMNKRNLSCQNVNGLHLHNGVIPHQRPEPQIDIMHSRPIDVSISQSVTTRSSTTAEKATKYESCNQEPTANYPLICRRTIGKNMIILNYNAANACMRERMENRCPRAHIWAIDGSAQWYTARTSTVYRDHSMRNAVHYCVDQKIHNI